MIILSYLIKSNNIIEMIIVILNMITINWVEISIILAYKNEIISKMYK